MQIPVYWCQVVAVKQLCKNQNREFLVELLMLQNLLHHPILINLLGYCADGDHRLLVFEFMASGSLEDHLFDISVDRWPVDWITRMKIAVGFAKGLEYLQNIASPPVFFRNLATSNILLDEQYNLRLFDFGLGYATSGHLAAKSDIYCFGVVLLELITGRRAIDPTRPTEEQNLVSWAKEMFKEQIRLPEMADPLLQGNYPKSDLNQAVTLAASCVQEESTLRPQISDVVLCLNSVF
ncbi:hypothetical protein AMTRI_Chr07g27200 [Amborella trichopoda]|uniref:Protein kinase domain-containing protein n=1 Tax=Amborella trichopoda TaxID=13333 RepID=W1PXG5_AMBTC|nr:hypothetical protein AMTR_s00050p00214960 [Amborella trichopoda]